MTSIRVMHSSDLHYCQKHIEWVDKAFSFACGDAIAKGAELAVISGDSFDTAVQLHEPAVDAYFRRVRELAEVIPLAVLQGTFSHDRPGALTPLRIIGGRCPVMVLDRISQAAWMGDRWVVSDGWTFDAPPAGAKILISALPSINKGAIAAAVGCENAATAGGELIHDLCKGWAPVNLMARAAGIPTVLVCHGTVNGCVTETAQALVSPDHEFSEGALFAAEAAACMVGHIHAAQAWHRNGRYIAYPGSITKLIYGHKGKTGYLLWDVHADRSEHQHIETPSRQMIEVDFDGPPDMEALHKLSADSAGAYLRIRWQIDEEFRHNVDKDAIRAMFAGAANVKLEGRINPVVRTRADGINRAASLADKLTRWAHITTTAPEPLCERLAMLEHMDPDKIVDAVIGDKKLRNQEAA